MKVCWFGLYKSDYSRNQILVNGLIKNDVEVVECNGDYTASWKYFRLIKKLLFFKEGYDILYCAFPINYNVIIAKLFQSKPVVIDAFFPLYDSYVEDRKSIQKWSLKAYVYKFLDYINLRLADLVIVDTEEHKKYWLSIYADANIEVVPVGADEEEFFPIPKTKADEVFEVLFQGTFIPLQGVEKIVEAAALLKDSQDIKFTFIGEGQTLPAVKELIVEKAVDITLLPYMKVNELNKRINQADLLLGIFGDTKKTDRVVPNKVFQGLAVRKPVLTKKTPAVKDIFSDSDIFLVNNEPEDIAAIVLDLKNNPVLLKRVADQGYQTYLSCYSVILVGLNLKNKLLTKINYD